MDTECAPKIYNVIYVTVYVYVIDSNYNYILSKEVSIVNFRQYGELKSR